MLTIKGPERHSAAESLLTSKFESPLSTDSLRRAAYNKTCPAAHILVACEPQSASGESAYITEAYKIP